MTRVDAYTLADRLRAKIVTRTGIRPSFLICPREKSDATPCVARDGQLAVAFDNVDRPLCVGCEHDLVALDATETAKHPRP